MRRRAAIATTWGSNRTVALPLSRCQALKLAAKSVPPKPRVAFRVVAGAWAFVAFPFAGLDPFRIAVLFEDKLLTI